MTNMPDDRVPRLDLIEWEVRPGDEVAYYWGQLNGVARRLELLSQDFRRVARPRDVRECLHRLEASMERLALVAYELRERTSKLVSALVGEDLDRSGGRHLPGLVARITADNAELGEALRATLDAVRHDVSTRNAHTHRSYLHLVIYTGDDVYDPYDAMLDATARAKGEEFAEFLRREIRASVQGYMERLAELSSLTERLLRTVKP